MLLFYIHRNLFLVSGDEIAFQQRRAPTAQDRLYEKLLTNYSKSLRPVIDQNSALNLSFSFELIKIFEVVSLLFGAVRNKRVL